MPLTNPQMNMRRVMMSSARLFIRLMTRTTIIGQENIPEHGPLLILANHLSTIDPMLLGVAFPENTDFVGPGDFKLMFPANLVIKWYGLIQVKRSLQLERSSLKAMTDILKAGKMLGLFPEGGTWEKPITDAKSGAAYISMTTGAPILPVGLGYTYQAWYKVARLQRPHLVVNIGKVMPPIQPPDDKSKRGEMLDAATQEIMKRIYELLPSETQHWYDDMAVKRYELNLEVWRTVEKNSAKEVVELPGGSVLAEVILKPNLISPLANNAKLPIGPLLKVGVHFPPDLISHAAVAMQEALHGSFAGYMEYRLGEVKSNELNTALVALVTLAADPTITQITLLAKGI